jgi:hypothetical protein
MRFGTRNVESLYITGSVVSISKEVSNIRFVRFSGSAGGGTQPAREYTFLYGKWNENHELGFSENRMSS